MEKIISVENLSDFAFVGADIVKGEIKGIMLDFMGLVGTDFHNGNVPSFALDYANNGILYVKPYNNPWCWMNKQAVGFTDEIIDVVMEKYNLKNAKIVSTGMSMGGLCALVFCAYTKHKITACITNCPVTNLVYHYTERKDLPRTLYSAFYNYNGTLEQALSQNSPYHIVEKLPDIPYTVFHCNKDMAVNFEKHALPFVKKMQENNRKITLYEVDGRGHCSLSAQASLDYLNTIVGVLNND